LRIPFVSSLFKSGPVVPVLRMGGAIGAVTPLRPGLSLSTMAGSIQRAFTMKGAKAVAIQVNSPGGSAVQSTLIYKRIRDLADEKGLPVYVFTEDVAASGGYLIGSIGVVASGFGFDKAIKRLGIERRVYTAGEQKVSLDPFQPEKADDVARLKELQADVHDTFVELVKPGLHSR
jgi:ClpP class serine protease